MQHYSFPLVGGGGGAGGNGAILHKFLNFSTVFATENGAHGCETGTLNST